MVKKSFILLLLAVSIVFQARPQNFIKYIFFDNKVKMVIPVEYKEITSLSDLKEKEVINVVRAWRTKNKKSEIVIYMPVLKGKTNLENDMNLAVKDLSFYTESTVLISDKNYKINNKQTAIVRNIDNGVDRYFLITVYYEDDKLLIISMKYNKRKEEKHLSILTEIVKSLTIQ